MIKKLTVTFAVLTAVCVLAIIPLTPFAVRDLANTVIPRYNQLKSVQPIVVFPLDDNITTLSLSSRDITEASTVHLTRSENKEIIVKSDQLSNFNLAVESSVDGDTIHISFQKQPNGMDFFTTDSPGEIWDGLIRLGANATNVEISIPDGLILVDQDGNELLETGEPDEHIYRFYNLLVDRNVKYLPIGDVISPDKDFSSQIPGSSFEARVKLLRDDLLQLVRTNAEGGYTQLEFNMNLNDCRIRMEALLLEYAEQEDMINYDKYKDQKTSSKALTGISGKLGLQLSPVDNSVDEAEAKALIRELCRLYLSRLVVQAKLDVGNIDTEQKESLEQQIEDYTSQIKGLEDNHTEFVTGLAATGLLF